MRKNKARYITTLVAITLLLISGFGLLAVSWNGVLRNSPSPILMVLLWVIVSASGIYLFTHAIKKAHLLWIHEESRKKQADSSEIKAPATARSSTKKDKELDITSTARKLVRRIPENEPLSESGKVLLNNLAKELEIMSGVVYTRKEDVFQPAASFALASATEPYTFREGEGLSGQAAANQEIMILTSLPEGHLEVYSGLGKSAPAYLAIIPLVHQNRTIALLECSGYRFDPNDIETMFRIFARDLMIKLSPFL